jgi:hypothetical protein
LDPTSPSALLKGLNLHRNLERYYTTGAPLDIDYAALEGRRWAGMNVTDDVPEAAVEIDYDGVPVPFALHKPTTQTLYVRETGDDVTGDGTEQAPFASVERALKEHRVGRTLYGFQALYGGLAGYEFYGGLAGYEYTNPPYGLESAGTMTGRMSCSRPEPQRLPRASK